MGQVLYPGSQLPELVQGPDWVKEEKMIGCIYQLMVRRGGALKKNANYNSDEVMALIGRTVSELLIKDGRVVPENLTGALQSMIEKSTDANIRENCREIIARLMKKMH